MGSDYLLQASVQLCSHLLKLDINPLRIRTCRIVSALAMKTCRQGQSSTRGSAGTGRSVALVTNKYGVRPPQNGSSAAQPQPSHAEFSGRTAAPTAACARGSRPSSPVWWTVVDRGQSVIPKSTDYVASASDEGVLRLPGRTELEPQLV